MADIERVKRNEKNYCDAKEAVDALLSALAAYEAALPLIKSLRSYYETDWINDVRDDEAGLFPPQLRRGVLTEDAIFDLLTSDAAVRDDASRIFLI